MRESSSPNDFINKAVVVKYFFENGPNEMIYGWPNMNENTGVGCHLIRCLRSRRS